MSEIKTKRKESKKKVAGRTLAGGGVVSGEKVGGTQQIEGSERMRQAPRKDVRATEVNGGEGPTGVHLKHPACGRDTRFLFQSWGQWKK